MKNEPASSSEGDRANGLERNSPTRFLRQAQDRQDERTGEKVSGSPKRLKIA
ncbi:MAG: hypothetical protein LBD67_02025 [Candidatus Accumulibacter sp.]|nr:hypothetical protein [Accumulibacter sp.]